MRSRESKRSREGLTLLEIVIVLTILAVVAGLAISIMPNLVTRSHLAKCSDTIAALNNAWMRAYALNVRYPDVCDSLLAADGVTVDSRLTPGLRAQVAPYALTAADIAALRSIGITRVVDLGPVAAGGSVTYDCSPLGAPVRVLQPGSTVAELGLALHQAGGNQLGLKRHLVRQSDGSYVDGSANVRYLIFGIGPNCSAVGSGRMLQEAPVHFGADDAINATNVYQRYLVVFSLVSGPQGVKAHFEAAAGNDVGGPSSAEAHIRQFHDAANNDG